MYHKHNQTGNKEEAEEILNRQKEWAINRYNYYKKISEE